MRHISHTCIKCQVFPVFCIVSVEVAAWIWGPEAGPPPPPPVQMLPSPAATLVSSPPLPSDNSRQQ